jgi:tetratricopeptide (TPR) repeat protein
MSAISEDPEGEWPHRLASLALSGLGRHQEAAAMARNSVRLEPHSAPCHITLAQVLAKRGSDLVEARAAADRAVSLAPLDFPSHMAVGTVAAKDARTEEATTSYQRALALEPDNWVAHNELARLTPQGSRFDSGGLARAAGRYASAAASCPPHSWTRTEPSPRSRSQSSRGTPHEHQGPDQPGATSSSPTSTRRSTSARRTSKCYSRTWTTPSPTTSRLSESSTPASPPSP